jgi:serine protease Do
MEASRSVIVRSSVAAMAAVNGRRGVYLRLSRAGVSFPQSLFTKSGAFMRQSIGCATLLFAAMCYGCAQQDPHTATEAARPARATAPLAESGSEQDFRTIISGAKTKVFPAVVFIKVVQQDYTAGEKSSREVSGSGVVISPKGEVLTNWHVVDKAVEVRCLLFDGRAMNAKVLGSDKDTDLALLQLQFPTTEAKSEAKAPDLTYAAFGDSSALREGDFVMAMGAPWGLSRSVSLGIISCTKRFLPSTSEYSIWLQTDAAISPGNSGGPLVNTNGEVIGINTRGVMAGGDIGFAVPSSTIVPVVDQLRRNGKVDWSWTGLQLQPLKDFNRNMYFEGNDGVIVADTDPDSPARRAGILPRDRILKVNGTAISAVTDEDLPDVRRLLGSLPRSTPATFEIERGTTPMTLSITPREKGKVEGEEYACTRWDCTVKTINQFENPDLYFQRQTGVFVDGVKYPGNASSSGLQNQDILLKVDGKPVTTLAEMESVHHATVNNVDDHPRLVLTILRNGLMRQLVLDISRDYSKQ